MTNNLRKNLDSQLTRMQQDIAKSMLGLDDFIVQVLGTSTNYPPANIIENTHGDYRIEIAVPGWHRDDLKVMVKDDELQVHGLHKQELPDGEKYLHRGLSGKTFQRVWRLGPTVELDYVELNEGLLKLYLKSTEKEQSFDNVEIR